MSIPPTLGNFIGQIAIRDLRPNLEELKEFEEPLRATTHDAILKHYEGGDSYQQPTETTRLQKVGLSPVAIQSLKLQLANNQDYPYQAGRLINGKVYVISGKDKVYYGAPNGPLMPLNLIHQTTSRCINQQVREYIADNGLQLKVSSRNNHRSARVNILIGGWLPLPIPQIRQADFINNAARA